LLFEDLETEIDTFYIKTHVKPGTQALLINLLLREQNVQAGLPAVFFHWLLPSV
jgi:hypothetical protein